MTHFAASKSLFSKRYDEMARPSFHAWKTFSQLGCSHVDGSRERRRESPDHFPAGMKSLRKNMILLPYRYCNERSLSTTRPRDLLEDSPVATAFLQYVSTSLLAEHRR